MRSRLSMIIPILLLCFLASSDPLHATTLRIAGDATAIDGDTLDMTGARVRLAGIDAPEASQTCSRAGQEWACGTAAKELLAKLVSDHEIICTTHGKDRYDRFPGRCERQGMDLGQLMVEAGLALVTDNDNRSYLAAGEHARKLRIGIWSGPFLHPKDCRARHITVDRERAASHVSRDQASNHAGENARQQPGRSRCLIKGNRNRRGEWIYHLPGRPYYDQTRPEEIFCTEEEAVRAGYRRSKA